MYLDNASTTPLSENVKDEIIKQLDNFGNPSSVHRRGRMAKELIKKAKYEVAKFISGNLDNVIFTSSGSASNSLVINGLSDKYMYLYTPTCHKSMRLVCESKPFHHSVLMNQDGSINIDGLYKFFGKKKIVFCYEMVNSEIGVIQNNDEIINLIHSIDGIIVADATALVPHYQLKANECRADYITFSGHKLGALKGIGVVYNNCIEELKPLIYGAQENGLFGGTENFIGIISLCEACKSYDYKRDNNINMLHHYLSDSILEISNSYEIVGDSEFKIPFISMFCFKNVQGEELAELLDEYNYQVSTGSACNSGLKDLSPTLLSIGIDKDDIPCCIRISLSGLESIEDLNKFVECLKTNVEKLRLFE